MTQTSRRGRPWTPLPSDLDADTTELLRVLRGLIDESGIGLKGLSRALTSSHFKGVDPPGYNTISRRLRGEGISNDTNLIEAVVQICAQPEQRRARTTEVRRLREAALNSSAQEARRRADAVPEQPQPDELAQARRRIAELQDELAQERLRGDESRQTMAFLLGVLGRSAVGLAAPLQSFLPAPSRPPADPVVSHPSPLLSPADAGGIDAVAAHLRTLDPTGERFAGALRTAVDEMLDGQRTGRYDIGQLHKTEKTHLRTKVETVLSSALGLEPGKQMDLSIADHEVDLKFSLTGNWMIPAESVGHICLLVTLDDARSEWSAGLLLAEDHLLTRGGNKDGKRGVSRVGREAIRWLFRKAPLPRNTLLALPREDITAIMSHRSAQQRVNELFRRAQRVRVSSTAVATVAMQGDPMKRLRDARAMLAREGIAALTWQQGWSAQALGLPVPRSGEAVAARLAPLRDDETDTPFIELEGQRWAVARPGDPVAPLPARPWPDRP
ncbi:NaeI family type II restriction endonuclease [Kitasatospora sp. NPDC101801]|uniref:NaeI family type II restriction endonuclease n=1 Tax=Kitasatospora sp. NPDC101801 TaxID=3364103 RepID=UPI00380B9A83